MVEVLVSMVIGMVITAAMMLLFSNASSQGENIQRASRHIENGRYATEFLRDDFALAGFFAEAVPPGPHPDPDLSYYVVPDPCDPTPDNIFTVASGHAFPTPIRGYAPGEALDCLANRQAGTDALAIRRLDVETVAAAALPSANAQPYLQTSFCSSDPVTTPLVYGTDKADFTLKAQDCATQNALRAYVSRIYFVASCRKCDGGGDGVPTLKRVELVGSELVETALVEGVETLRLEYGFDTDGDGDVDAYLTAPTANGATSHWENVMSLRMHLIVRATTTTTGAGLATAQEFDLGTFGTVSTAADGFVRKAYTSTVRLANPSGSRER